MGKVDTLFIVPLESDDRFENISKCDDFFKLNIAIKEVRAGGE